MGYTLDQLEAMGAKPVTPQTTATPTAPKKKYTAQELQSLGATPVSLKVPEKAPEKSFINKISDFFAPGVADVFGSHIARARASEDEKKFIEKPTGMQTLGAVGQTALLAYPGATVAKAGTALASKFLPKVASKVVGNVASGLGVGYGYDVGTKLTEGKTGTDAFTPGIGTAIGVGLPLAGPALRGVGRVAGEGLGISTGAGYGAIKEGLKASAKGGDEAMAFRDAMRGNVSPDQIVDEARGALGQVISNRTKAYRSQLEKLKTNVKEFDTNPVIQKFNKQLEDFGVDFTPEGLPDFSRSPGLQRYEKDLYNMSQVLKNWGTKAGDNTVVGIDKLKQVLDDFRIGSRDSQKFDSFVTALRNETKGLIKKEPGYDKLVKDYETSTGLIKEIQRGLSLGDRAQADTAFRKLTTTLRTNNEFRKLLIDELNEITGGTLTPKIAGQQLSELAPRGLARIATGALGVGGVASGIGIIPILKAMLFTSPRLIGEILSALGYGASKIKKILEVITPKGLQFPGDELYDRVMGNKPQSPRSPSLTATMIPSKSAMKSGINVPLSKKNTAKPITSPNSTLPKPSNDVSIPKTLPKPEKKSIGKAGKTDTFERAKDLSKNEKTIETKAFEKIRRSEKEILKAYKEKRGKVINTDEFRPFFTDVGYNGTNAKAVQEPASYLSKKAYTQGLQNPEPLVTFQAGGSGTGKTTAVKQLKRVSGEMRNSAVILDSNFSSYKSAMSKIREAEKAGKSIKINFVYRHPLDSLVNGVVKRMLRNKEEMGRLVPLKVIAENHIDSFDVVRALQDQGYKVRYIDNSLGQKMSRISTRKKLESKIGTMSKSELEKKFTKKIKELYEHGIITKEQYNGYLG